MPRIPIFRHGEPGTIISGWDSYLWVAPIKKHHASIDEHSTPTYSFWLYIEGECKIDGLCNSIEEAKSHCKNVSFIGDA